MLGTLVKWLRIMGHDTEYARNENDDELIKKAYAEERVLITRDKQLSKRYKNSVLITSTELKDQIKKVIEAMDIRIEEKDMLSRCTLCNVPVIKISKEEVVKKVPPYAHKTHDNFWICPKCNRVYWLGTHWENMKQFIEKIRDRG